MVVQWSTGSFINCEMVIWPKFPPPLPLLIHQNYSFTCWGFFFIAAIDCSLLGFNGLFALLPWNYCLLAACPNYMGCNKGSNFKEGGQKSH